MYKTRGGFSYHECVLLQRALISLFCLALACSAKSVTVLVLPFHNSSSYPDLSWVGESISETLKDELSAQNQIVYGREARGEALHRMSLRAGADLTKATLIRLGQSLGANYVCYGTYQASLPPGDSDLKHSSVQVSAHILDLRKLHDGPDWAEAGKLVDLARVEEHLAWQVLRYLDPASNLPVEKFLAPGKLTRVDAVESYIRGLLSSDKAKQQQWFLQALALDGRFASPAFELGKLALERKEYRKTITWLERVPATDPRYAEARFAMGLAAYHAADYGASANYFREIARAYPLNEVYNNLGAAENQLNQPNAADDIKRALEGDANDPDYLFNLGNVLLKQNQFDEAASRFRGVLARRPDDTEAQSLLGRAQRREFTSAGGKSPAPDRLKSDFDLVAFQQLKALVQSKGS